MTRYSSAPLPPAKMWHKVQKVGLKSQCLQGGALWTAKDAWTAPSAFPG